jgi:class 3 adenylate cyclase
MSSLPAHDETRQRIPRPDEFEAEGLLDRRAADVGERLNLLRIIAARGGSLEAMREAATRGALVALAAELMFRPPVPCHTLAEVAARTGLTARDVRSVRRACRLAAPRDGVAVLSDGDIAVLDAFREATELFGADHSLDFLRLVSGSVARIADAAITMFVTTAGAASLADDDQLIEVSRRSARLADGLAPVVDVLLRQHLVQLARPNVNGETSPFETRSEAVGFADLSDFTTLASEVPLHDLGRILVSFERRADDVVTVRGGRLIKFVGDGVMFAAQDLDAACRIALDLVDSLVLDRTMPAARAGVAAGSVLVRDGDCFGPVVNAAARAVQAAAPRTVVAASLDPGCSLGPDLRSTPLPDLRLRGVTSPVRLAAVDWLRRTTATPSHREVRR